MANPTRDDQHPYDRALKSLMEDHAAEMLAELVPDAELVEELNVEITRTNLRCDLVYLTNYRNEPHVINLELQTDGNSEMAFRMLQYHVELYDKYRLPVISQAVYPFVTSIPDPIFLEKSGDEILLQFPHRVLKLWEIEAEPYLQRKVICMYTLLPAMKNANARLLLRAIDEMRQTYTDVHLGRHLLRFKTILHRSKTVSEQDKKIVEDRLNMYDSLLDNDPEIRSRIEQHAAQRAAELAAELAAQQVAELAAQAKIQGQQKTVMIFIQARFPTLTELAQKQITQINSSDNLDLLTQQIALAPDEATARWALSTYAA